MRLRVLTDLSATFTFSINPYVVVSQVFCDLPPPPEPSSCHSQRAKPANFNKNAVMQEKKKKRGNFTILITSARNKPIVYPGRDLGCFLAAGG